MVFPRRLELCLLLFLSSCVDRGAVDATLYTATSAATANDFCLDHVVCEEKHRSASATEAYPASGRGYEHLPKIEFAEMCVETGKLAFQDDHARSEKACKEDQIRAKEQLTKNWMTYRQPDRHICVEAERAPVSSYVELLTCLDLASVDVKSDKTVSRNVSRIIAADDSPSNEQKRRLANNGL